PNRSAARQAEAGMTNEPSLYDTDFLRWTERNVELLRSGAIAEADWENIAEELEDMGKSRRDSLESRIIQILEHLLKLRLTAGVLREQNERGWRASIIRQQAAIERLLRESPSLTRRLSAESIKEAYRPPAKTVAIEYGFKTPPKCPFSLRDVTGDSK